VSQNWRIIFGIDQFIAFPVKEAIFSYQMWNSPLCFQGSPLWQLFCDMNKKSAAHAFSGAPYPYRKEKETHELIFSWLLWLAVLLMGAYAQ